ncbi:MAG TPA: LPXTG cell wall anchor domain-containing protein [Acidimicrobiales bacterium]|nr:LPXTG cell wall anchor domain-containing protein [Acidimicrobiales bacterium]
MIKGLIAAAALAIVAMAAPAGAQQYPPAVNSLTISDTTPTPGQTISIEGRTFATGSTATVTLFSDPVVLGSAIADAAGVFALQATIPADTPLGHHTITAEGTAPDGSPLSLSVSLTVVPAQGAGAGAGNGSGNLPRTGSDSSIPLAKLGLGMLAIGGIATAIAAKRRKAAAAAAEPLTPAPPLV